MLKKVILNGGKVYGPFNMHIPKDSNSIHLQFVFVHAVKDDNDANKKFVKDFQSEYGRLPSLYASQGYDTGKLLMSAMDKASVKDMGSFREALRSADFDSTRGQFSFSSNHHPIQDIYVREVIKEGDILTNKIVSVGLKDHSNAYVSQCSM